MFCTLASLIISQKCDLFNCEIYSVILSSTDHGFSAKYLFSTISLSFENFEYFQVNIQLEKGYRSQTKTFVRGIVNHTFFFFKKHVFQGRLNVS